MKKTKNKGKYNKNSKIKTKVEKTKKGSKFRTFPKRVKTFNKMNKCEKYQRVKLIFNISVWILLFSILFYKGSKNLRIWGVWQGFEIVPPTLISFFVSGALVLVLVLIEYIIEKIYLKLRKNRSLKRNKRKI